MSATASTAASGSASCTASSGTAASGTVVAPARILAVGQRPRTVRGLRFTIVPDPRRVRLIGSDLHGAIEVRQHLDSPIVAGTVIVHRLRADLPLPHCAVVDGPCQSEDAPMTFLRTFAALIHDDDLDAVIDAVIALHDRAVAP